MIVHSLLFLSLCGVTADNEYDNTFSEDYSYYAAKIRADKLKDYDKIVPPRSKRVNTYSKAGALIDLEIRFFKVHAVDAASGLMNIKVWVRMSWTDLRISWNPADYGNVTQVHYVSPHWTATETSEIWLPDIQLYNSEEGTVLTLEPTGAVVQSNGRIFWSRPGMLKTMCKFSGLVAFPYDRMKCAMEWGGWALSGGYQGIALVGDTPGYEFSDQESSAGSSYQEYSIDSVQVEMVTAWYDCCPNEPWPLAKYVVTLKRASFYYSLVLIAPTVLLTSLSFGVFFMAHDIGERLSFGITLVLVIEVMKVTVATFVPVCGELLWVDLFMWICTIFSILSLLESVVVLFLANHSDEFLLPDWLSWMRPSFYRSQEDDSLVKETSCASEIYSKLNIPLCGHVSLDLHEDVESDSAKLIYYEKLFCDLDPTCSGLVSLNEVARFMNFVNLRLSMDDCMESLSKFDKHSGDTHFGRLTRLEFVEFCTQILWYVPIREIQVGAGNFMTIRNQRRTLQAARWQKLSSDVDKWCRFWIPFLYSVALGVMANLDFSDSYMEKGQTMFEGFGEVYISHDGVVRICLAPAVGFLCFLTWLKMRAVTRRRMQRDSGMKACSLLRDSAARRASVATRDPEGMQNIASEASTQGDGRYRLGEQVHVMRNDQWDSGVVTSVIPPKVRPSKPVNSECNIEEIRRALGSTWVVLESL